MARATSFTFYQGVNLNLRTNDTFYFASRSDQSTYFASKAVVTVSNCYYQRTKYGSVKVQQSYNTLYKCDYLSFINADYENKRFYGIITDVTYIDDSTTMVSYVIDYIQTWLLDCTLPKCFIERMHSNTDTYGENMLDDAMACGEYVNSSFSWGGSTQKILDRFPSRNLVIVLGTCDLKQWVASGFTDKQPTSTWVKNGIYDNLSQVAFLAENTSGTKAGTNSALQIFFNNVFNGSGGVTVDDIVNIYMYPAIGVYFIDDPTSTDSHAPVAVTGATQTGFEYLYEIGGGDAQTVNLPARPTSLDGYVPKNNKMLQWPYCLIHISNNDGSAIDLKYERFRNSNGAVVSPQATIGGTSCGEAKLRLTPQQYLNMASGSEDFDTSLDTAPYPTVSMTGDVYNIYIAQNKNRIANGYTQMLLDNSISVVDEAGSAATKSLTAIGGAEMGSYVNSYNAQMQGGQGGLSAPSLGGGTSTYEMNLAKIGMNMLNKIRAINAGYKDMKIAPATASGISGVGLAYQHGKRNFTVTVKTIDSAHAKAIDDYYTMYGYPVRHIDTINMYARANFTYVKTVGCMVKGNVPEDAKEVIAALFDSGIRFWCIPANIGDYSVINTPRGI